MLTAALHHPDAVKWSPAPEWRPEPPDPKWGRGAGAELPRGIIVGWALSHYRDPDTGEEKPLLLPGDRVTLMTIKGMPVGPDDKIEPVRPQFLVCDHFRSEMSEYDANYVFVPLDYLQELCDMRGRVTSIQIRLKDYKFRKTT